MEHKIYIPFYIELIIYNIEFLSLSRYVWFWIDYLEKKKSRQHFDFYWSFHIDKNERNIMLIIYNYVKY